MGTPQASPFCCCSSSASLAAVGHAPERDAMSAHGGAEEAGESAPDPVRGLAVSDGGLRLALQQTELRRGRPAELRFSIVGADGQAVRDFEVEHEKRMHLIVVRRDGEGFQHLHPELGDDGVWRVAADAGRRRRLPRLRRFHARRRGGDAGG